MSQNGPKTTSLLMSLTKNPQLPTKNFLFKCNLLECPIRLTLEQLSSTIGRGARALVKQLLVLGRNRSTNIS